MAQKENKLAQTCTSIAMRQLAQSYQFKLPRIQAIQKYRRLYNGYIPPKLRSQFNVPIPVFSGMIDTLQSDLDDSLVLEFESGDPADWNAIRKANAAIRKQSNSMEPDAMWDEKWRQARMEAIITGRGVLKFIAGNRDDGEYYSNLEVVPFEDFFFEPLGGGDLEKHMYAGQQNIWRTKKQLEDGVDEGIYDADQVKKLVATEGNAYKMSGLWDGELDIGNRFKPLGLDPNSNNYSGENMYHLCEWVLSYEGRRWNIVFDAYSGNWIRFQKHEEVNSSGAYPWISFASHKDQKNFASKSFSDDLYPVADAIITLLNQELTNRQKRNLNAKAYDKGMFKDLGKLDEAQYRPDALVPVDTYNGARRINEGIYAFQTPEITGTVDLVNWLDQETGQKMAVSDTQQGGNNPASKKVGVAYAELEQAGKRVSFMSQPFIQAGQQLGMLFLTSLKDYMKEPMAVKLIGETGFEWDVLKRLDLSFKRTPEITVVSRSHMNKQGQMSKQDKQSSLEYALSDPILSQYVNKKAGLEYLFKDIGGFGEYEVAILLDTASQGNKDSAAELSSALQEIGVRGVMPKPNYDADLFFLQGLILFSRKHRGTLPTKKFKLLMQYIDIIMPIVQQNIESPANKPPAPMQVPGQPPVPGQPTPAGAPMATPAPTMPPNAVPTQ